MGSSVKSRLRRQGGGRGTHHFALPRQEDEVATHGQYDILKQLGKGAEAYLIAIPKVNACGRRIQLVQESGDCEWAQNLCRRKAGPANVIIIVMYFEPFVWLQHRGRKPSSDQELHVYEDCVLL